MHHNALFWLVGTIFWTMVMSFYSTQEMATISCNKLRLEYYVKSGKRWAIWLQYLIEHPTILFSTTLIGVNVALMASSECARELYHSLGLNPNLAPLTHIPFILLFGELVPMFAARTHPEHMSRLGIPFLYLSAKLLTPLAKIVEFFFRHISRKIGGKEAQETTAFLSREELQKLIEEHETGPTQEREQGFDAIIGNIFALRNKQAFQLMEKLHNVPCMSSHTTVEAVREFFKKNEERYILVYRHSPQKIVGLILPQDLLPFSDTKKIGEAIRTCSFVTEDMHGFELMTRLQEEKSGIAVVLDRQGAAVGAITNDDIFDELFSQNAVVHRGAARRLTYLEKTFPADTKIADFNEAYGMGIDPEGCVTFAQLIERTLSHTLGRNPAVGDILFIHPIEIEIKETSLFKVKTILIRSK